MEILTDKKWQQLQDINNDVNYKIIYTTDKKNYGKSDKWAITNNKGDCEDYALTKRQKLIELDWNYKNLRLATCWINKNKTGYHAVLIVITNKGDFVLDNRSNFIETKSSMKYIWDKIQDENGNWCKVG
jgi:predicted transglutaminase-like cysteine proteinase